MKPAQYHILTNGNIAHSRFPCIQAQDTCCAALASLANAVPLESTEAAESAVEEARLSVRREFLEVSCVKPRI